MNEDETTTLERNKRLVIEHFGTFVNKKGLGAIDRNMAATGRRFTFCELHLMRFEDGKLVENWVGGLNPLMYETWRAPATTPLLLGAKA